MDRTRRASSRPRHPMGTWTGSRCRPRERAARDVRLARRVETATQTYHRLTSYAPGLEWDVPLDDPRLLQDIETKDISRLPWFYKRYDDSLPRIGVPRGLAANTAPAVAGMAGTADVPPPAVDLPQLPRLLPLSAGVTRTAERPYTT